MQAQNQHIQLQSFNHHTRAIDQIDHPDSIGLMEQDQVATELGFQKLDIQDGIFIQQKLEMVEVLLGCETQNTYYVHSLDDTGKKAGSKLFTCKEKSGFCQRQCLEGSCRPFQINVSTIKLFEDTNVYEPFLKLDRPCKCTFLCANRPELSISLIEGGQTEYLGKVVQPFNFCNMELNVFDKDNNHKYTIFGSCQQLGFWCKWPCEPCQTLDFSIATASGEIVGNAQRRSQGCLKAMFSDVDSFAVNFPQNCPAADKAILMSAILFLDYNYFERSSGNSSS